MLVQLQAITFKRYTHYIRQAIRLMYMKTFKIKTELKRIDLIHKMLLCIGVHF